MSDVNPIISIQNVNKFFGTFQALADVSLTVETGQKVVVIGPSGSGKSTLLRTINQLEEINSGSIVVDGRDLGDPQNDINRIREEVGMVFQSFNLFRHKTVLENLTLAPHQVKKRTEIPGGKKGNGAA